MKILIIKNRYTKKTDFKKGIQYFTDNTPIKFETIDEIQTDFDFEYRSVSNGTGVAGVVVGGNYYDKLRTVVSPGKYDIVCLLHGNQVAIVDGKPGKGIRVKIAEDVPLYPNTDVIQLINGSDYNAFTHEIFHVFFHKLVRKGIMVDDPMDKVVVNGKTEFYFNDTSLTANPSNRTIAIDRLKPYWNALVSMQSPIVTPTPTPTTTVSYKYFKLHEIVGLKPELVQMLDVARGLAGVPFIITSGFRTESHNADVGGVKDSSHITGLAVDLLVKDSVTGGKILLGLVAAGFKRFGFYEDGHIHVDIDPTKPTPCYWQKFI